MMGNPLLWQYTVARVPAMRPYWDIVRDDLSGLTNCFVRRQHTGEIVRRGRNLRILREMSGKHPVKSVAIGHCSQLHNVHPHAEHLLPEAYLHIVYDGGVVGYECWTGFTSFGVLRDVVAQWRNLYGADLFVDGTPHGVVGKYNIYLAR